jgi:hypothetical protein
MQTPINEHVGSNGKTDFKFISRHEEGLFSTVQEVWRNDGGRHEEERTPLLAELSRSQEQSRMISLPPTGGCKKRKANQAKLYAQTLTE